MANKKFKVGMLVMVLVFGMTVIGCGDGNSSLEGTWVNEWGDIVVFGSGIFNFYGVHGSIGTFSTNRANIVMDFWEGDIERGTFSINGNILTLTFNGESQAYTKTEAGTSITITGIPREWDGSKAFIYVVAQDDWRSYFVARSVWMVSGNSVTFRLLDFSTGQPWHGGGWFSIELVFDDGRGEEMFLFTDGMGVTTGLLDRPPRFNITGSDSIPFNRFRSI